MVELKKRSDVGPAWLVERGVEVDHVTFFWWVGQRCGEVPLG